MKIDNDNCPVPADAIEALARCLLPAIRAFYESEEGRREFAEWQAKHSEKGGVPCKI